MNTYMKCTNIDNYYAYICSYIYYEIKYVMVFVFYACLSIAIAVLLCIEQLTPICGLMANAA